MVSVQEDTCFIVVFESYQGSRLLELGVEWLER